MPGKLAGSLLTALVDELDWERLGRAYCEGDGSSFFDEEARDRIVEVGMQMTDAVMQALPARGPRRSLYLGAAVAEIVPILMEHVLMKRDVIWLNLPGDETDELCRALDLVGKRFGQALPRPSTRTMDSVEIESCDHLWMTSVLTDPDAFPALHDELYERDGSELATGRGSRVEDRRRADTLVRQWLARAARECVSTTTDEELTIVEPLARAAGMRVRVADHGVLSPVVGDPVRVCRLAREA